MRLCLVIPAMSAGGAERVMSILADSWSAAGHDVRILTTHDAGRPPHYQISANVKLISVDPRTAGPTKQMAIMRRLRAAIRGAQPDVVISFLNYTNVLALIASRGLKCPVIVSERLDPRVIRIGFTWSLLRRATYRWAARLVVQTPTAAGLYEHLARGRTLVIPNPVPMPRVPTEPEVPLPLLAAPTILAMGRLQYQKGFDLALRAMSRIAASFPEWQMVILGDGPERPSLEALRDQLGLSTRVYLPGSVANPETWLRQAQIFLMSSRSEGFPNALCEAMALGLPVVSTDCPSGPSDIITTGVDGLLVAPDSPEAIAEGLMELLGSEQLRRELAAAAPRIATRFRPETVMAAWNKLLIETAGHSEPSPGSPRQSDESRSSHQ